MRLGIMYDKILPSFYLRRDKRLIAHEVRAAERWSSFTLAAKQTRYGGFLPSCRAPNRSLPSTHRLGRSVSVGASWIALTVPRCAIYLTAE